ncbi:hypothetical protein PGH07_01310 [Sulfurovum sp. zt1-1]|uniref:Uncharacterized protein n=1 Tax=Sulfurovum zhangzhouensis TaxID=3019067 RepID=A0ABT7QVE8_9BACT|nr:hypothetical protein [Sulfurovum zhangzhouensis]MDM5270810.1 hypothetical protein [Sulfurovum zhangzhouensis]
MEELSYKEEIEALRDDPQFEAKGDELYMSHKDDYARLEWAFYRPSGSHPDQVSDINPMVSIMAFNHSRLGAFERFSRVHPDVITKEHLRVKIRNRSRMLFRAMVDDDFKELISVLEFAPVFLDLACDQVINGRIWNESYADLEAASAFLGLVEDKLDKNLTQGIKRRLQPIKKFNYDEAKAYLETLVLLVQNLHSFIKSHYVEEYTKWLETVSLHPLQRIALEKKIELLKE